MLCEMKNLKRIKQTERTSQHSNNVFNGVWYGMNNTFFGVRIVRERSSKADHDVLCDTYQISFVILNWRTNLNNPHFYRATHTKRFCFWYSFFVCWFCSFCFFFINFDFKSFYTWQTASSLWRQQIMYNTEKVTLGRKQEKRFFFFFVVSFIRSFWLLYWQSNLS